MRKTVLTTRAHIVKIQHNGRGTEITALTFVECDSITGNCELCRDGFATVGVQVERISPGRR